RSTEAISGPAPGSPREPLHDGSAVSLAHRVDVDGDVGDVRGRMTVRRIAARGVHLLREQGGEVAPQARGDRGAPCARHSEQVVAQVVVSAGRLEFRGERDRGRAVAVAVGGQTEGTAGGVTEGADVVI